MKKIYLIGIGPGNRSLLTAQAVQTAGSCEILFGAPRMLELFSELSVPFIPLYLAEEIAEFLNSHSEYHTVGVLYSGDIGLYSGAKRIRAFLSEWEIVPVCGISSAAYFCGCLGIPWEDVNFISCHGKTSSVLPGLRLYPKNMLLTAGRTAVRELCRMLCEFGLGETLVSIGENLSYPEERITKGRAEDFCEFENAELTVVLLEQNDYQEPVMVCGIPDEEFIRAGVPMTKQEVRVISLSKLALKQNDIVYDIGAGTGSVSVEASQVVSKGMVYAIEKNPDALSLIKQNRLRFRCENMVVVSGEAPQAMASLPRPDKAFIGGSSGRLEEIIQVLVKKNPEIHIVINAITLESLQRASEELARCGFLEPEIIQIGVTKAKKTGRCHMMTAQNPVFVISARH